MDGTDAEDGVIKLRCASSGGCLGGGNVSHRLVEKLTNTKPIAFRGKVPPMQDEEEVFGERDGGSSFRLVTGVSVANWILVSTYRGWNDSWS